VDERLLVSAYIAKWQAIGRQMTWVNWTLALWDEWLCNEYLPADLRRDVV
jgi:hypothetical protein